MDLHLYLWAVTLALGEACSDQWNSRQCSLYAPRLRSAVTSSIFTTCDDPDAHCFCLTCPEYRMELFGIGNAPVCTLRAQYCLGHRLRGGRIKEGWNV